MAIQKITASVLGNNAVTAANVAAGALSAADIADNSITAAKLSTSTFAIDSLTVNTSDLVVNSSGNVGIGTSTVTNSTGYVRVAINDTSGAILEHKVGDVATSRMLTNASSTDLETLTATPLTFGTNAAERMRIDASGNLFLNTTSAMDACFVQFTDHSNGEAFLGLSSKDDNNVGIRFGVGTTRKWINYRDTSNNLIWYDNAAAAERMRIDSSGNVVVGTTNDGAPGLTIEDGKNLSFGTGNDNESYVNFFRQSSSAAAVMATGYRRSSTANKMESSIATSWAKSAIAANYGQIILYTDPASADAVGTTLTPTERLRVYDNGIIGINKPSGPAVGGFGTPAIVVKQWVNSDWGGINIEANGNDSVFSFSNSDTSHIIAGSYRSTAGYKDIAIKAGGAEKMRVRQSGGISIKNTGTYEIDFEGANSTNIRSQRAIYFLYDNGNNGDAYFGIGHNSDNAVNMLGRYKTSSGTNGSATGFIGTSFGNSNGQTSIGQLGLEPQAPFHILKGGLTMDGYASAGVAQYLHSSSDSGQWMHMNAAGRSGSGVGNFELYIPTAQSTASWGSFGGDLFLSGYNGQHEYIIWRGYTNSGLAGASGTVVTGTGSPTITIGQNGSFGFYIKVSNISMTHPVAMYRVCKGGNPGREWDLSEISCRWY